MADSDGWNTIESDAGVFTFLLSTLGAPTLQCSELHTLDAHSLTALTPLYGLIFLFKYPSSTPSTTTKTSPLSLPPAGHPAPTAPLWFAHQVIPNACATLALLHIALNLPPTPSTTPGPLLSAFKDFTEPLPPAMRGLALSNSAEIRSAHNEFARGSPFVDETTKHDDDEAGDAFHFVAYLERGGELFELDGLREAPVSHGACGGEEGFAEKVVEVVRSRIERYGGEEIRFALLGVGRDVRVGMREVGDWEGVRGEEERRWEWGVENELRRANFVGFGGEVLRMVVGGLREGGEARVGEWVEGAKRVTRRRVEEGRRKKAGGGGGGGDVDMG